MAENNGFQIITSPKKRTIRPTNTDAGRGTYVQWLKTCNRFEILQLEIITTPTIQPIRTHDTADTNYECTIRSIRTHARPDRPGDNTKTQMKTTKLWDTAVDYRRIQLSYKSNKIQIPPPLRTRHDDRCSAPTRHWLTDGDDLRPWSQQHRHIYSDSDHSKCNDRSFEM